jgi:hypothetical protein
VTTPSVVEGGLVGRGRDVPTDETGTVSTATANTGVAVRSWSRPGVIPRSASLLLPGFVLGIRVATPAPAVYFSPVFVRVPAALHPQGSPVLSPAHVVLVDIGLGVGGGGGGGGVLKAERRVGAGGGQGPPCQLLAAGAAVEGGVAGVRYPACYFRLL